MEEDLSCDCGCCENCCPRELDDDDPRTYRYTKKNSKAADYYEDGDDW